MDIDVMQIWYLNRNRFRMDERARALIKRAAYGLECDKRGHMWKRGMCQRCGALNTAGLLPELK